MAEEKKLNPETASVDPVTVELLKKAQAEGIETIFDRNLTMKACPIGAEGACCQICAQGPCRVPKPKKAGEETKGRMGLCGATAETISARNFARMVCGRRLPPTTTTPGAWPCSLRKWPTAKPRDTRLKTWPN